MPSPPRHPVAFWAGVAAIIAAALPAPWSPWSPVILVAGLGVAYLAWRMPQFHKWKEATQSISDGLQGFLDPLRDVYSDTFLLREPTAPPTLDVLVAEAGWPPYDPVEPARDWVGESNLDDRQRQLFALAQLIYPPVNGGGSIRRRSVLDGTEYQDFNARRKGLKESFNYLGEQYQSGEIFCRLFLKREVSPYRNIVKTVGYMELALAQTEAGENVGTGLGIRSLWGLSDENWPA